MEICRFPNPTTLVISRVIKAKTTLELGHRADGHEIHRVARRKVDPKNIRPAAIGLGTPPMVGGPGIEDRATANRPRRLALHSQKVALAEVDNQVVWMPTSERNKDIEVTADESG
jgi:hypothetical protein